MRSRPKVAVCARGARDIYRGDKLYIEGGLSGTWHERSLVMMYNISPLIYTSVVLESGMHCFVVTTIVETCRE